MAEIQDVDVSEIDVVSEQIEEAKQEPEVKTKPSQEDEIPDEFRGKSPSEIARIALHARREMGKQANELGEVRKLADELIRSQLSKKPEEVQQKEVDFFENPQEAIRHAVENNPKVLSAENQLLQFKRMQAQQTLVQRHPDFAEIVRDDEFASWIKGSKIRTQLFQAAEAYDIDAADELLSTFKQLKPRKPVQVEVSDAEKSARTKTMQAAAVDTGGSGESSRKVYRRADLIRLKMSNPSKFDAMQDEIDAAYREGRVK